MKIYSSNKIKTALLAGTAFLLATMVVPQQAKADSTLAAVLGGTALFGLIMHAQQPVQGSANNSPISRLFSHQQPMMAQMPQQQPLYQYHSPAVYAPSHRMTYVPTQVIYLPQ